MNFLDTSIKFLKGVGPKRADLLAKELGIHTFEDLLTIFPFRYNDRSKFHAIRDISSDSLAVQLKGKITRVEEKGSRRAKRLVARLRDDTGSIDLVWFKGQKWIQKQLIPGNDFVVYGKPGKYGKAWNIAHPDLTPLVTHNQENGIGLQAVYSSTEKLQAAGLHSKGLQKIISQFVTSISGNVPEVLPQYILDQFGLVSRELAFKMIHAPKNIDQAKAARARLKFEELFFLQLKILLKKGSSSQKYEGNVFATVGDYFKTFYSNVLPFELTGAQKRVIKEIRQDLGSGLQMNRLLQGDVGSGKTMVALLVALIAADNGFQSCLMAPTEILASQHFESFISSLETLDIHVELLTGSTKTAKRREIHERLLNGEIHILIGTHALLEDIVQFKNLGLVIIDEQHRFGVAQRARLWKKSVVAPHILVMTATPIPRTLAMTLYGDLDVSVIDELPPGRKSIQTWHKFDSGRSYVFGFMDKEIQKGRQIYVVYPLIEESEKLDYKDLMDGFESISRRFPKPKYQISIVHGQMSPKDKDYEMQRFAEGKTQIMVATTVIEVGVNVPNASVMIIESAERFGLSQLHQLRGRVGRGASQSYCVLMTGYKLSEDSRLRMETMVRTNDGFEIAEVDLRLRGPGDMQGTQQSGIANLKLADISKDAAILKAARSQVVQLLNKDHLLSEEMHQQMKQHYVKHYRSTKDWSKIS